MGTARILLSFSRAKMKKVKLSILPLFVGSAAAGVLAMTPPAHALTALTWTANNITFADGGTLNGTFDWNGSAVTAVNLTVTGPLYHNASGATNTSTTLGQFVYNSTAQVLTQSSTNIFFTSTGSFIVGNPYLQLTTNSGSFTSFNTPGASYIGGDLNITYGTLAGTTSSFNSGNSGTLTSNVPFNIPGGATIPTFGSLLALGAMRKARKSMVASKTPIANPVCETVS